MKSVGTEIQLLISCRQQAAVLTMPVDSQLPLAATHSFCIVNKQFKGKCQPRDGKSGSGYNISFLLPADVAAQLPGKWRTWWVMRMAHTNCSVGSDSNKGWHHSVYRSSRPCGLTPYLHYLLSHCASEIDLAVTYKCNWSEGYREKCSKCKASMFWSTQCNHGDDKDTRTPTARLIYNFYTKISMYTH